jgi:segregation and condensation protein B
MEVLAIIAYKQPVTKGEIESIRGIKCDRVLEGLAKKELIQETGRGTGIGRPILYGTTNAFLKLFGFVNLSDLPDIEDIGKVVREDEEEAEGISRFQQISIDFRNA